MTDGAALFDGLQVAILVIDGDGVTTYANARLGETARRSRRSAAWEGRCSTSSCRPTTRSSWASCERDAMDEAILTMFVCRPTTVASSTPACTPALWNAMAVSSDRSPRSPISPTSLPRRPTGRTLFREARAAAAHPVPFPVVDEPRTAHPAQHHLRLRPTAALQPASRRRARHGREHRGGQQPRERPRTRPARLLPGRRRCTRADTDAGRRCER